MPSYTKTWHTTSYPAINPKRPELSAKGKNVIITGGGSGIGARTALSFAEAGASNIALVGRTESKLESTKQGLLTKFPNVNFHNIVADIMDRHAIKEGFLAFSQAVGKVDVLVSNAGYGAEASPIDSIDFDEYFLCLDVNLKGSVIVGYSFAQVAASDAVIVNLASIISFLPFAPNFSAYAVSKAAGVRFFDAVQYEHPDWRVYNIQPGTVDTSMSRKAGVPASDDGIFQAHDMKKKKSANLTVVSIVASGLYTVAFNS